MTTENAMTKAGAFLVAALFFAIVLPVQAGGLSNNLLLSSAWCTFSYNKVSGYSKTTRVRFSKDGTYRIGNRGEGYSSGKSGSMASQQDSGSNGSWKVVKGELYLSEGKAKPGYVKTVLKRNNNGYPIIIADGVEYSQCK
jgi:hypothetical protein